MEDRTKFAAQQDELVAEMTVLRGEINTRTSRLQVLSQQLYHQTRRAGANDQTSAYLMCANATMRFAGMISQGLARFTSTDRLILAARRDLQENMREQEREAARLSEQPEPEDYAQQSDPSSLEAMADFFGQEMTDAPR